MFLVIAILSGGVLWLASYEKQDGVDQSASMLEKSQTKEKSLRQPAVAGQFYPGEKQELVEMLNQFLGKVSLPEITEPIRALIVPHAGYVYSGQVAAYGFKTLENQPFKTIILIGSSHNSYLTKAVIDGSDAWQTILGEVDLANDLRDKLVKESSLFEIDSEPHRSEHSLEVEVPFLQMVLDDFKLLPVLIGHQLTEDELNEISQALVKHFDDQTLLIASSDMSHYPAYEQANQADQKVIEAILTGQTSELGKTISQLEKEHIANLDTSLCAQAAVEVIMKVAQAINVSEIKLLKYANSGDVAVGDKSEVVGYSAISFSGGLLSKPAQDEEMLNESQRKTLLDIAKTSVEQYVQQGQWPDFSVVDPLLKESLGAFVTLKKDGQLRGCIGRFEPDIPLYQVVSQMAVAAASQDVRFQPIQVSELADLEYEVSVLSPLKQIADWQEIELGRHGVQVRQGSRSGVFLPQVATENNWDLDKFMGELCSQKAGLSWDCWKNGEVDLYVFTAEIFGE